MKPTPIRKLSEEWRLQRKYQGFPQLGTRDRRTHRSRIHHWKLKIFWYLLPKDSIPFLLEKVLIENLDSIGPVTPPILIPGDAKDKDTGKKFQLIKLTIFSACKRILLRMYPYCRAEDRSCHGGKSRREISGTCKVCPSMCCRNHSFPTCNPAGSWICCHSMVLVWRGSSSRGPGTP